MFPLKVRFVPGIAYTFTLKGENLIGIPQTLFWDEIEFEVPHQPPRMKLIHGVEVPDISFVPDVGEQYYYPLPSDSRFYGFSVIAQCADSDQRNHFGLCYPFTEEGKQAAILHAKAMLGIKD